MPERTKISVVIPVYNEAATIGRVIERVLDCGFDPEVIVVDDASTDGTTKFLREFSHPQRAMLLSQRQSRQGRGAAAGLCGGEKSLRVRPGRGPRIRSA